MCSLLLNFIGKAMAFPGHALYIRVQIFFFKIWGLWISKDAEFNVDFKK
jgi:hypothetical protein